MQDPLIQCEGSGEHDLGIPGAILGRWGLSDSSRRCISAHHIRIQSVGLGKHGLGVCSLGIQALAALEVNSKPDPGVARQV